MITATLTRPTQIAPIASCDRKIRLVEKLDIGLVAPPRARTIYLEPLPKRSRKKRPAGSEKAAPVAPTAATVTAAAAAAADAPEPASDLDSTRVNENSTEGSASAAGGDDLGHDAANHPRSPVHSDVRSEVSGESGVSGSTGLSRGGEHSQARESGAAQQAGNHRLSTVEDRTITATIELLKGGCLPGDMIPVKISVQHIKRIKSLHGVIVTLYRQGRIDSAPPIPIFKDSSKGRDKEDYYPTSRTGLGGLSLSSAGSCSVFRKDLSQAFSPLIIDPVTLTASVTTSVRVPVDVFPTIKDVPGDMITFKYQLEVIVDLGGKLASQIQSNQSSAARMGGMGAPPAIPLVSNPYEGGAASLAAWGGNIIDTDRLRREKGVISVAFELIVGTEDSQRQRGRGLSRPTPSIYTQNIHGSGTFDSAAEERDGWQNNLEDIGYRQPEYSEDYGSYPADAPRQYSYYNPPEPAAPFYVPPPEIPDNAGLSEKERIRQAEQRLLPSQPTQEPAVAGPSSPTSYLDGANIYDAEDEPQAGPSQVPTAPPAEQQPDVPAEAPSAPTLEDLTTSTEAAPSTDDKQELERLRLLAEASAPPEFPEDCEAGPAAGPSSSAPAAASAPTSFEPSAPVLDDEDEAYGGQHYPPSHLPSPPPEALPRYER